MIDYLWSWYSFIHDNALIWFKTMKCLLLIESASALHFQWNMKPVKPFVDILLEMNNFNWQWVWKWWDLQSFMTILNDKSDQFFRSNSRLISVKRSGYRPVSSHPSNLTSKLKVNWLSLCINADTSSVFIP